MGGGGSAVSHVILYLYLGRIGVYFEWQEGTEWVGGEDYYLEDYVTVD